MIVTGWMITRDEGTVQGSAASRRRVSVAAAGFDVHKKLSLLTAARKDSDWKWVSYSRG